jgi:hypothetical protein
MQKDIHQTWFFQLGGWNICLKMTGTKKFRDKKCLRPSASPLRSLRPNFVEKERCASQSGRPTKKSFCKATDYVLMPFKLSAFCADIAY